MDLAAQPAGGDDGAEGSGKSSLAFDTIYAEGQRRYVESLSAYARQFLGADAKAGRGPDRGLSPAISIEQKTTSKNPRSTVGTVTEIYDYLRLLFARFGIPYSPATGLPIESQTVSQMVDRLSTARRHPAVSAGTDRPGRKGEYRKELAELRKRGFQRVKVDGTIMRSRTSPRSTKSTSMTSRWWLTAWWCARTLRRGWPIRIETALDLSDGLLIAEEADSRAHTLLGQVRLSGLRLHHR